MANNAVVGILRALLTADTAQFESGMRRAADSSRVFQKDMQKMGRDLTQLGASLTKVLTVPLLGIGVGAAKLAMDFESSFAGVRKTVQATEAEFKQMAQGFRDLSKTIPINVNELNRLGEAAGALGIPKKEIVDFARVMALLGVTTNLTSDQAAESIAKIQTQFQAAGKATENFASTLVALGNEGASTEAEILELATRIASAGNAAGMSQANVLGFAAAMANVGINAESGGTALSAVFNDINRAVARGGEDLEKFAAVAKVSTEEFARQFKTDAAGAVETFIKGLGRVKDEGGNVILTLDNLGFTEMRQADTLRRLAANTQNVTDALALANKGWRENSALSVEAGKRFETTQSQLTLLWNRVKDVGITIGNALLPMIKATISTLDDLLPIVTSVANAFAAMPVPLQAVMVGLGLTAAAAGPVLFVFGQLISSAGLIVGAFGKIGLASAGAATVMTRAAVVARTAWVSFLGPIGLAAGALALLHDASIRYGIAAGKTDDELRAMIKTFRESGHAQATLKAEHLESVLALRQQTQATGETTAETGKLEEELRKSVQALQDAAGSADTYAGQSQHLTAKLADAKAVLAGLTKEQRDNIVAGGAMHMNAKEIVEAFKKLWPQVKLTETAVQVFTDTQGKAGKATKDATKALKEHNEAMQEDIASAILAGDAYREYFDAQQKIDNADTMASIRLGNELFQERIDKALELDVAYDALMRDSENARGLALMERDAALMAGQAWKVLGDIVTDGFSKMFVGAISFKDGFLDVWKSLQAGVSNILTAILNDFTGRFIKGILAASTGKAFSGAFAGMLGGAGAGAAGTAGAGGIGAGGTAAAVGGGIGMGTAIAATGGIAAAAVLAWAIAKKGLFRGGEEALKVNPARDEFIGAHGGVDALNKKAIEAGTTLDKLFAAKKVKDFEAAVRDLEGALGTFAAGQDAILQKQQLLEAATQRYGFTVEELGPTMQRQALAEQAEQLIDDFKLLTESGMGINTVIGRMGESINAFVQRAVKTGTEIPEAMRTMLQTMVEQGTLTDEAGNKLMDLESLTFGETLTAQFSRVLEKIEALIDAIGRAGSAIANLPSVPTIETDVPRTDDPTSSGYHKGGLVTAHKGLFLGRNFKPGEVLAKLLTGEGVLSRSGMENLGGPAMLRALNMGRMKLGDPMSGLGAASSTGVSAPSVDSLTGGGRASMRLDQSAVVGAIERLAQGNAQLRTQLTSMLMNLPRMMAAEQILERA